MIGDKSKEVAWKEYWHSFKGTERENDEKFKNDLMSAFLQGWTAKESVIQAHKPTYDSLQPRKLKNRQHGNVLKVVPLFMPIEKESRLDFQYLLGEIEPAIGEYLKKAPVYSGLVLQEGYLVHNHNGMWMGLMITPQQKDELFEDMGLWSDQDQAEHEARIAKAEAEEASK